MSTSGIFSTAWDAKRVSAKGRAAILDRQHLRLNRLVRYARRHSPYYARLYRGLPDIIRAGQLPPVSKVDLMANFENWVTDPAIRLDALQAFLANPNNIHRQFLERYTTWTTSGTTGDPAILLHDHHWRSVQTGLMLARLVPVVLPISTLKRAAAGNGRTAALFSTGGPYLGVTLVEQFRQAGRLFADAARAFSVLQSLPELTLQLNEFQPVILVGYATAIAVLAREQLAGRLKIAPALVFSSGETLHHAMRNAIEQAWGISPWDVYGTSETGIMAQPCRLGKRHFNEDWFLLEPLDEHGRLVPPGALSRKVLVSNLAGRVQPIIRYEMSDSVTFDPQPCSCGSPLPVIHIEGRTDEILSLPAANGTQVQVLPMAIATVVESTPGVRLYQVIQTGPSELTVRLETISPSERDQVWQLTGARLAAWLSDMGVARPVLRLDETPPTPDPRSGKMRHVYIRQENE